MKSVWVVLFLMLVFPSIGLSQIEVPAESKQYQPIPASVTTDVPEGARVKGPGWVLPAELTEENVYRVDATHLVICAPPGTYEIAYKLEWLHIVPVTFIDGSGTEITIQSYLGDGEYDTKATFTVVGEVVPPDPPLPPDPPQPAGPYQVMFFVTADQRDELPKEQRALFTSLVERQWLRDQGHVCLEVLDPTRIDPGSVPGQYRAWYQAVQGKTLPAVGIAPKEGGDIVVHPLPSDSTKFRELLAATGKGVN